RRRRRPRRLRSRRAVHRTGGAGSRLQAAGKLDVRSVPSKRRGSVKIEQIVKRSRALAKPFRITDGARFRLDRIDPGETLGFGSEDKPRAKEALATGIEALAELQDMLYAQDRWAVLLVFQAMDAAGKDGTIKHVLSGINPQGCEVYSFKAPS